MPGWVLTLLIIVSKVWASALASTILKTIFSSRAMIACGCVLVVFGCLLHSILIILLGCGILLWISHRNEYFPPSPPPAVVTP